MKLYLDMSALKRPYDDQSQDRIWLETMAVMRILKEAEASDWTIANSVALVTENAANPNEVRRLRTDEVLRSFGPPLPASRAVLADAYALRRVGFTDMDALHLASAKTQRTDHFITCDDGIIALAHRHGIGLDVLSPVDFIKEHCQ